MSSTITLKNKTIIVTVGPTGCGKSHLIKNNIVPDLTSDASACNVQVVSVNAIRERIIQDNVVQGNDDFHFSGQGAYELAKCEVDVLTKYPTNKYTDVVVIDSSGMDLDFLRLIVKLGKERSYTVHFIVFSFNDIHDYFTHSECKDRSRRQRDTMLHKIIPFLRHSRDINVSYISNNFEQYKFYWKSTANVKRVKHYNNLYIISSMFGDMDVANIVKATAFKSNDVVVIMGNYIGDDMNILTVIKDLTDKFDCVIIEKGNAEKMLNDRIERGNENNSTINEIYNAMTKDQIEMFKEIWEKSVVSATVNKYEISTNICDRSDLECDTILQNKVYNDHDSIKEHYNNGQFVHICCYPPTSSNVFDKSTYIIGSQFTFLHINYEGKRRSKSYGVTKHKLYDYSVVDVEQHKPAVNLRQLDEEYCDPYVLKRMNELLRKKVNYISGTISPSDKSIKDQELETIDTALRYYHTNYKNLGKLSIQVKDMGSRLQFYYFVNDKNKSYATSRNGFTARLSRYVLDRIYDSLTPKLRQFTEFNDVRLVIVDGELMPWSAMGKSLIDSQFTKLHTAAINELDILRDTGFEELHQESIATYEDTDFRKDFSSMSGMSVHDKYKGKYETFKMIRNNQSEYIGIDETQSGITTFGKQLDIYAQESTEDTIYYKPFSILKYCYDDMEQLAEGNVEMYAKLSENKSLVIDLEDDIATNVASVHIFWNEVIKGQQYEGIIVKPDIVDPNFAPCLKVRNSDYLHIIYGPDYLTKNKYSALITRKSIRNKLSASIREYNIGLRMLEMPYDGIDSNNIEMKRIYYTFIEEEEREKGYDKAL